jgi:hypothetical protein
MDTGTEELLEVVDEWYVSASKSHPSITNSKDSPTFDIPSGGVVGRISFG